MKNNTGASSIGSSFSVLGPTITSLTPNAIVAGSADTLITIAGTNFVAGTTVGSVFTPGSTVYSGSTALTVTAGTATSITAIVPTALLATAGPLSITVRNSSAFYVFPNITKTGWKSKKLADALAG